MKKSILLVMAAIMAAGVWADQMPTAEQETLVVYFSATGTTRTVATQLAQEKNAYLWEIEPYEHYTAEDLDWHNKQSRSSIEMADEEERPIIKQCMNIMPYKVIYLGFPIWWGICPRIIQSWLDNNVPQLEGKTIYPFATSGSSPIEPAVEYLKKQYPTLNWQEGTRMNP